MKLKVATVEMTTDDRDKSRGIDKARYRYPLVLHRPPARHGLVGESG
jgi:hypothetical protein